MIMAFRATMKTRSSVASSLRHSDHRGKGERWAADAYDPRDERRSLADSKRDRSGLTRACDHHVEGMCGR
jgi:hypothetical protein